MATHGRTHASPIGRCQAKAPSHARSCTLDAEPRISSPRSLLTTFIGRRLGEETSRVSARIVEPLHSSPIAGDAPAAWSRSKSQASSSASGRAQKKVNFVLRRSLPSGVIRATRFLLISSSSPPKDWI